MHYKCKTHIDMLDSLSCHATGTSFILMMEHEVQGHTSEGENKISGYKDYSYHPRFDQPCQGGETRKYKGFNRDVTQPHNRKPTDLYHPFPEGKPSAISFPLSGKKYGSKELEQMFDAMFSAESPWLKGFGSKENVRYLRNELDLAYGVIIGVKNLDVDPTVMINCIQVLRNSTASYFVQLVEAGATPIEALAILMLNHNSIGSIGMTYDYYFCSVFSARRFFGQAPNDLSGGYYSDRTDYNRTYVQDVFQADKEDNGIKWHEAISKETGVALYNSIDTKSLVKGAKAVFAKALENEGPLTNKPYVYRNAQGKVIDLNAKKETPVAKAA